MCSRIVYATAATQSEDVGNTSSTAAQCIKSARRFFSRRRFRPNEAGQFPENWLKKTESVTVKVTNFVAHQQSVGECLETRYVEEGTLKSGKTRPISPGPRFGGKH